MAVLLMARLLAQNIPQLHWEMSGAWAAGPPKFDVQNTTTILITGRNSQVLKKTRKKKGATPISSTTSDWSILPELALHKVLLFLEKVLLMLLLFT